MTVGVESSQVLTTIDRDLWRSRLPCERSVFGSVEFASIVEQYLGYRARLFTINHGEDTIAYPSFLRSISELPFASGAQAELWDSISPEYTGLLSNGSVSQEFAQHIHASYDEYCREEGIVAEFSRLHPWSSSVQQLPEGELQLDREILYVDLTISEEDIWQRSFNYACRKNITRALREGVRVFPATKPEDVEQFYNIYAGTMDRRGALCRYRFQLSYFMGFFKQMPDNATFLLAEYKDQVIAATLYLHDDVDVYSYLGGADQAFQHARPTNAVVYEAIRWAQRAGKKRLVLGGGYEPDDGIFRFKASFTPLRAPFYVRRRIQMEHEYAALCTAWSAYYNRDLASSGGYFPAYRSIPNPTQD